MAYIGRPLNAGNLAVQSGTGDGSDTTPIATLNYATTTNGIAVYLDGVRQLAGTDYNVTSQTTLTFTTAPANGVGVDVYFLGLEVSIPTPADSSVSTAKIANNAVDETKLKDALIGDFTDVTVTASDTFLYGDATDSGNTKRDTVQGILDLASGGAWAVLSSGTLSGASELVITGLTKTSRLYLQCVPSSDGPFMILLSSTNGGSSYASSYSFESSTNAAGGGQSIGQVSAGVGNASGENLHLTLDIFSPATSHHTMFESSANHSDVGGQNYKFLATNTCLTAQSTNAIKLYFSSSATMTGSYTVIELN